MPNILSVSWTTTRPFSGKFLPHPLGFPKTKLRIKFEVLSSSGFEDMFDHMPKILWVTWPKPCPFWGKLFMHPVGIPCAKLRTKFEVSSSNSFEDILNRLPKNLGVTWFKPRPFWGKITCAPAQLSQDKVTYQIWSQYLKLFWRYVRSYAKKYRGHVT